jgi:hypothetical protein
MMRVWAASSAGAAASLGCSWASSRVSRSRLSPATETYASTGARCAASRPRVAPSLCPMTATCAKRPVRRSQSTQALRGRAGGDAALVVSQRRDAGARQALGEQAQVVDAAAHHRVVAVAIGRPRARDDQCHPSPVEIRGFEQAAAQRDARALHGGRCVLDRRAGGPGAQARAAEHDGGEPAWAELNRHGVPSTFSIIGTRHSRCAEQLRDDRKPRGRVDEVRGLAPWQRRAVWPTRVRRARCCR